jgi:hypothetical protein
MGIFRKVGLASEEIIVIVDTPAPVSEHMWAYWDFSYDKDFKKIEDLLIPDEGEYTLETSDNGRFYENWTGGCLVNLEQYNRPYRVAGYIVCVKAIPDVVPTQGPLTNPIGDWDLTLDDTFPSSMDPIVAGDTWTIVNTFTDRGKYNASTNLFPEANTVYPFGDIQANDRVKISQPGTLDGDPIEIGEYLLALVDNPGQNSANWNRTYGTLNGVLVPNGAKVKALVDDPGQNPDNWLITPGELYARLTIARV